LRIDKDSKMLFDSNAPKSQQPNITNILENKKSNSIANKVATIKEV